MKHAVFVAASFALTETLSIHEPVNTTHLALTQSTWGFVSCYNTPSQASGPYTRISPQECFTQAENNGSPYVGMEYFVGGVTSCYFYSSLANFQSHTDYATNANLKDGSLCGPNHYGAGMHLALWHLDTQSGAQIQYQSCWNTLNQQQGWPRDHLRLSKEECANLAESRGHKYFGLEYYIAPVSSCITLTQAEFDAMPVLQGTTMQVTDSECGTNKLGRGMRMALWEVTLSSNPRATGDPHCENLKGERFEIKKRGVVDFIRIPQKASQDSAEFNLQANIEGLADDKCFQTFITKLVVDGTGVEKVVIEATENGPKIASDSARKKLAHDSEQQRFRVQMKNMIFETSANDTRWSQLTLQKWNITFRVETRTYRKQHYLNFHTHGLRAIQEPVGGILGLDDHFHESYDAPADCNVPHNKAGKNVWEGKDEWKGSSVTVM